MHVRLFDYHLPREFIAKRPIRPRDAARLLDITKSRSQDKFIRDLPTILNDNDLLVVNDTKVLQCRLSGKIKNTRIELTLHKRISNGCWAAFAKPARRIHQNDVIIFNNTMVADVVSKNGGEIILDFKCDDTEVLKLMKLHGRMPIPPYIKRIKSEGHEDDRQDYQSIFANRTGAIAAPTASLHFTSELLTLIKKRGIKVTNITLHVGAGTFLPVTKTNILEHNMHSEWAEITDQSIRKIKQTRASGGRIVAVGTTSLRVLETCALNGQLKPFTGETNLFITPGFKFNVVDMLLTNFHQPRSTLLMLVSAFAGRERILDAYNHAIKKKYRFFSYGDACLISRNNEEKTL